MAFSVSFGWRVAYDWVWAFINLFIWEDNKGKRENKHKSKLVRFEEQINVILVDMILF